MTDEELLKSCKDEVARTSNLTTKDGNSEVQVTTWAALVQWHLGNHRAIEPYYDRAAALAIQRSRGEAVTLQEFTQEVGSIDFKWEGLADGSKMLWDEFDIRRKPCQ